MSPIVMLAGDFGGIDLSDPNWFYNAQSSGMSDTQIVDAIDNQYTGVTSQAGTPTWVSIADNLAMTGGKLLAMFLGKSNANSTTPAQQQIILQKAAEHGVTIGLESYIPWILGGVGVLILLAILTRKPKTAR